MKVLTPKQTIEYLAQKEYIQLCKYVYLAYPNITNKTREIIEIEREISKIICDKYNTYHYAMTNKFKHPGNFYQIKP